MNRRDLIGAVVIVLTMLFTATTAFLQGQTPTPAGRPRSSMQQSSTPCVARPAGRRGTKMDCASHTLSPGSDLGYTYDNNPLPLPAGMDYATHVSSVAINSKGHIFVFHRAERGKPQLLEFDQNQKFVRGFGEDIAVRAHGMTIDPQDNIWIDRKSVV